MPGYNHYPDCTCGWCFKGGGGSSFSAGQWRIYLDERSAKVLLDSHGASRGGAACFVNPNAKCPVCLAQVYYYENRYGSRVFFDCLGPPWDKHPCTDRSEPPTGWKPSTPAPTVRAKGLAAELVEAASLLGRFRGRRIFDFGVSIDEALVQITSISRRGFSNQVAGRFVEVCDELSIFFTFESALELLQVDDLVSIRGTTMSAWDGAKERVRKYTIAIYRDSEFSCPLDTEESSKI